MQTICIWFEKRGRAKYISHLDLMRCLSRTVRRAGVPLWYTEGFHPHPYLNFPRPLPLGQEGLREPLLLRLEQPMPFDALCAGLNAALPEGLHVLEATAAWGEPGEITAAGYAITFDFAGAGEAATWAAQAETLLAAGNLKATRMGKQGHRKVEKEVDVAALLLDWRLECAAPGVLLRCTAVCGTEQNLNPALLCAAVFAGAGEPPRWNIARTGFLRADGSIWE
ncbi:MAG: TIGR03936 family radical SAM-associated protein [Oscillospiraceae bacterium]|nr:TIGR03936 family radical SAM-associated protein [Oscillospiraceae bacterium]